jgi:hypothetical protein
LQAELSTSRGESTFSKLFQTDETLDELSSRRNSAASIVIANINDEIRIKDAMQNHGMLLVKERIFLKKIH